MYLRGRNLQQEESMYVVKKRTLFEPTFASTQLGFWQKLYNAARMTDGKM